MDELNVVIFDERVSEIPDCGVDQSRVPKLCVFMYVLSRTVSRPLRLGIFIRALLYCPVMRLEVHTILGTIEN